MLLLLIILILLFGGGYGGYYGGQRVGINPGFSMIGLILLLFVLAWFFGAFNSFPAHHHISFN